ncbi:hypothetical protein BVY03_01850 [bacterium K02(2017)]|nr:hypothetical protein BVY03_01850 [bacterium K02(2017)]
MYIAFNDIRLREEIVRQHAFFYKILIFAFVLMTFWAPAVWAENSQEQVYKIIIEGSILDESSIKGLNQDQNLIEFTSIICEKDPQTDKLKMLWSLDNTGGPDCILNPPQAGVFSEISGNQFNITLGGPSQPVLPSELKNIDKRNLKVFLLMSVNEGDWNLITPKGYKFEHPNLKTVSADVNIYFKTIELPETKMAKRF